MKGKKKSPSKVRYDAGHPVMSFRLSLELRERLDQYVKGKGLSYADYIKETLDAREERDQSAWHEGYYEGYEYGEKAQEERIEGIERKLAKAREEIGQKEAYINKIAGANQGYARRNQELEGQLALVLKSYSNMTIDEIVCMTNMILQARTNFLRRQLRRY
jgi:hypothetical protein